MLSPGEVRVWHVRLDGPTPVEWPAPSADEELRAAAFHAEAARERYLRAHRALRAVLARATDAPLHFAATEKGKPWLPAAPDLKFSLSRSHEMALIAVALDVDVGVDVERVRPIPEFQAIGTQVGKQFSAALTGQTTVDKALADAQTFTEREMKRVLNRNYVQFLIMISPVADGARAGIFID